MPIPYAKPILTALALAGVFAAGWTAQGWRADAALAGLRLAHAETLGQIAEKTKTAAAAVRKAEAAIGEALAAADTKHTEELGNAKAETQRYRDCVRAGTCGVRIVTRYVDQSGSAGREDAAPGSVGDDAVALDAAVSERVLDLRDAISEDGAKLAYFREYAQQCYAASQITVK